MQREAEEGNKETEKRSKTQDLYKQRKREIKTCRGGIQNRDQRGTGT